MRLFWLSVPSLALLMVPFVTLAVLTPWSDFHTAYGDGQAVAVSLGLSMVSIPLIIALGLPLALWLARTQNPWRSLVEVAVLVPLLTPPLAMGILLISVYGPYGSIGEVLNAVGVSLNNNAPAFVLAQVYGALPYFVLSARVAFENVPRDIEEAGQTLGASPLMVFWRLTLPVAARGLAAGLAIAWVRVIGEFGIVMVFCYFPQGIPVKLFINLQNDGVGSIYPLLWILLVTTLPLPLWCLMRAGKPRKEPPPEPA
ncbi:MAG: ABC transporter permease subunit [Ewingella americana]|nr:ABC transporter permease subunit [Ewingella americana]MCI1677926.1 ABC transporter permease subunit [Ewingella americana]MCI1855814.1 ABC transporter permease subunit [Ewingella americana]MCI1863300.1 ABC transporter permease subunit [Ewingella americana]MCI2141226.1 ABC transporter permease subunit [Ewingella americana]MCI2164886.1 ABC transporter permease subunit [Ewingella americana]